MTQNEDERSRALEPNDQCAAQERPVHGLYLHIPFCRHRCGYCDFNTYQGMLDQIVPYTRALEEEIARVGRSGDCPRVGSVFFGGGTPSLLPLTSLEGLMAAVRRSFVLDPVAEITLEANPGTLNAEYLDGLCQTGVNRLSLGMQSAQPEELRLLEREHRLEDTIRSMEWARLAGFQNINLDLIFGLPRQQMSDWQDTLRHALGLRPEHLSLYPLTLEEGTRLRRAVLQGRHPWPDDDQSADMYIWAEEALEAAGFVHYEISNWARRGPSGRDESGFVCRHNLQYWRNLPYLGLGAGAHGYAAGYRYSNVLEPRAFMRRMRDGEDRGYPLSPAAADSERIGREEEMRQTMWLGLRLTVEGVAEMAFSSRFGASPFEVFAGPIQRLLEDGLLEGGKFEQRIRLTKRGRLLGNRVFIEFV